MYLFASPILAQHLKRVKEAAMHSTCLDKHVGCVILNCSISGQPEIVYGANIDERRQCLALGHCRKQDGLSCPAIHAEICALQQLGELRNKAEGRHRICFCTLEPCEDCTKQLIAAGVQEVFFMQHTTRIVSDVRMFCPSGMDTAKEVISPFICVSTAFSIIPS